MILDCPEAVDEALTDLYGDDSFMESLEYLGAFERYENSAARMGTPGPSASACFTDTAPSCFTSEAACFAT